MGDFFQDRMWAFVKSRVIETAAAAQYAVPVPAFSIALSI
jgi:hypothetical protein